MLAWHTHTGFDASNVNGDDGGQKVKPKLVDKVFFKIDLGGAMKCVVSIIERHTIEASTLCSPEISTKNFRDISEVLSVLI